MKLKSHKEILEAVAMETGFSVKTVSVVVSNFWKTFRYYLTRPEEAKYGILIEKFIRVRMPLRRLLRAAFKISRYTTTSLKFNTLVRLIKQQKDYKKKWLKKTKKQKE